MMISPGGSLLFQGFTGGNAKVAISDVREYLKHNLPPATGKNGENLIKGMESYLNNVLDTG